MKTVKLDKISSVVSDCKFSRDVRVVSDIPCIEGAAVAVRVLTDKTKYNMIELPSGRMAEAKRGDIIAGALGHRKALFGYSGHLPESLKPGDKISLLNMGGVLGICDSVNGNFGPPFECEVLGAILDFPFVGQRVGVPAMVGKWKLLPAEQLQSDATPVIAIAGTCMNSGKTTVAASIIKYLVERGYNVAACKATGVSLRRDVYAMADAGASMTSIFTDFGVVTTTGKVGASVAGNLISYLSGKKPDVIVMELGDGILGAYGVEEILFDEYVKQNIASLIMAANDPVGAWGAVKLLRERFGIEPAVVTGPATDNAVGTTLIRETMGVPAWNVREDGDALAEVVLESVSRFEATGKTAGTLHE
ncbi:MAG: hypothetical protein HKN43_03320 [Rhodothermales bacterium]|nr:hypothetical protein [Rhodothermales bacterium]